MNKKLSIIIAVFNEEKTILNVLKSVSKLKNFYNLEIIVINDGSKDNSEGIIKQNDYLYDFFINYSKNLGKGYAIKKGLEKASGEFIIFQDADAEYDPEEIKKFIEVIERFNPDVILGSRFNYDKYTRSHNIVNKFGNLILTFVFNLLFNTTFTDIYCCYLCFRKELLEIHKIKSTGFEQQAEILSRVIKKGNYFYEVPVNYNGRSIKEGKKIRFYHIIPVFIKIISERLKN